MLFGPLTAKEYNIQSVLTFQKLMLFVLHFIFKMTSQCDRVKMLNFVLHRHLNIIYDIVKKKKKSEKEIKFIDLNQYL